MYKMITGMVLLSKEEWAAVKQLRLALQAEFGKAGSAFDNPNICKDTEDALWQSRFIDREGGN